MKVVNIGTYRLRHIWLAYVKQLLLKNPTYYRKHCVYNRIIIKKKVGLRITTVIDYQQFKKIAEGLLSLAKDHIIQGEAFHLPCCGKIYVKRVQRDFRAKKKSVDWRKTMLKNTKFDENGKRIFEKMYYFTNDDYLRVAWSKPEITNQTYYEFQPAYGDRNRVAGFKVELNQANLKNPLLKLQYLYCPLKDLIKQVI